MFVQLQARGEQRAEQRLLTQQNLQRLMQILRMAQRVTGRAVVAGKQPLAE
ncbi:hypothetical protein APX70_200011 [Pseudomonas syringae pv. maculicola]|uniref:Uncharacterized protein n=1 Tax=Pseudomonas syringae pv. maculicola TaxID=59511 RepID=A0A3M2WCY0_PSEYM|nr:hypothetical protein APX70_200011 [Pseudomonas syringae pv. maculicola]